ncbi:voltage-gated sodium channel [Desulfobotulus alkaliphilus]|uniref:Voltage-gated sodium channel n=1 Tax=Desulfobotulus alkaliphilus TaxID=622671 RepID=A0A562S2I4_9BACT|nr:ion transporter [Desulfobotulus alkaliphilus]TWI75587.1 voltage-gated sodium channel [Desulfobotulus alkaliphilus]
MASFPITLRERCHTLAENPRFKNFIIAMIILNAIVIGMETYPSLYLSFQKGFYLIEKIFIIIFTIEILIRIAGSRPCYGFFKDGWNLFDFFIVASSLVLAGGHFVSVLRILRILRVLRTISIIPSLQRMIGALLATIPAMGNIAFLLGLLFYVFSVMGTIFFGSISPEYFGSMHVTLLTLFQVVTLESWASGVMRPLLGESPWAWLYFVSFILMGTFIVINLFIGVIVNNMQESQAQEQECTRQLEAEALKQELAEMKALLLELNRKVSSGSGR